MGRTGRVLRRRCWVLVCVLAAGGDRRNTVSVDGALELAPATLDFQQVAVHDQRAMPVTLSNRGRGDRGHLHSRMRLS